MIDSSLAQPPAELDAKGLACPMPLLKTKMALNKLQSGQRLRVFATDPGSVKDFHAFARLTLHTLEVFEPHNGFYEYVFLCQHSPEQPPT